MPPVCYHFQLGDFRCIAINERDRETPADAMFGNIPADERAQVLAEFGLLGRGMIPDAFNVLYIDTGQDKILIDTGRGQGDLYAGLAAEGIAREAISKIYITHGHGDHIGGLLDAENTIAFPNADYFIGQVEWDYWLRHPDLENRVVRAWADLRETLPTARITFMDTDEQEVLPGFCPVFLPGHTPGMMGLLIESGGERMLHVADVAHHPLQCAHPDYGVSFDINPLKARETRWVIWDRAERENLLVMAYHFRNAGRGHIVAKDDTWTWEPVE